MLIKDIDGHVAALEKVPFSPKLGSETPGQMERLVLIWEGGPGQLKAGLWECTTGRFASERSGFTEIAAVLSGRVVLESGGERREYGPGDLLITPDGWTGTWSVLEPLRKAFFIASATQ